MQFLCILLVFQSTLPRRERLSDRYMIGGMKTISIHAPAKGATGEPGDNVRVGTISIHAPAKGATLRPLFSCPLPAYFNPRSREGSDYSQDNNPLHPQISIHAPAKGATGDDAHVTLDIDISIHAPAKGATGAAGDKRTRQHHFNPRSREGSDAHLSPTGSGYKQFQSTLPRRERL